MFRKHARILAIAMVAAAGLAPLAAQTAKPAAVAGKWTVTLETESFTANSGLEFKQEGEKLTGTYTSSRYGATPLQGTVKDRAIEFTFKLSADGTEVPMAFKGEVAADGQTMKGRASISDMGDATWTAKKAA
jgi:hypothetical protein